jgi:hypothetical protein
MIKNYLKIAFRNFWRQKIFSSVNVVGSAAGMTACFLLFLYVKFELRYDSLVINASLVGLASHVTIQRTKEIGICKVLGAFLPNIALFTISLQAIKAAIINPVKVCLRAGRFENGIS